MTMTEEEIVAEEKRMGNQARATQIIQWKQDRMENDGMTEIEIEQYWRGYYAELFEVCGGKLKRAK